jgi:hypothetical protein
VDMGVRVDDAPDAGIVSSVLGSYLILYLQN